MLTAPVHVALAVFIPLQVPELLMVVEPNLTVTLLTLP